jgi:hypothetical protein
LITPDEYAQQRGVSGRAVRKAIATGRLVQGAFRDGGRWKIDPAIADQEWQRNTAPQFQREKKGGGRAKGEGGRPPRAPVSAPPPAAADAPMPKVPSQAQAAAVRTMYQARLLELDLKERQAQLVPKADVERVWFEEGRRVRDAVRRTPQQMIGDIARAVGGMSQQQRAEVLLILERHLVKTLQGLAGAD